VHAPQGDENLLFDGKSAIAIFADGRGERAFLGGCMGAVFAPGITRSVRLVPAAMA